MFPKRIQGSSRREYWHHRHISALIRRLLMICKKGPFKAYSSPIFHMFIWKKRDKLRIHTTSSLQIKPCAVTRRATRGRYSISFLCDRVLQQWKNSTSLEFKGDIKDKLRTIHVHKQNTYLSLHSPVKHKTNTKAEAVKINFEVRPWDICVWIPEAIDSYKQCQANSFLCPTQDKLSHEI